MVGVDYQRVPQQEYHIAVMVAEHSEEFTNFIQLNIEGSVNIREGGFNGIPCIVTEQAQELFTWVNIDSTYIKVAPRSVESPDVRA